MPKSRYEIDVGTTVLPEAALFHFSGLGLDLHKADFNVRQFHSVVQPASNLQLSSCFSAPSPGSTGAFATVPSFKPSHRLQRRLLKAGKSKGPL